MEQVEALSEGEWCSFSDMFSMEETDFMAQLLGNYRLTAEQDGDSGMGMPSAFWPVHEASTMNTAGSDESTYYCSDTVNSSLYCFPQGSSHSSGSSSLIFPTMGHENYYLSNSNSILVTNNSTMSMDFPIVDDQNTSSSIHVSPDNLLEDTVCLTEEMSSNSLRESGATMAEAIALPEKKSQPKRKLEMPEAEMATEDKFGTNPSKYPSKKSRVLGDVQKTKKNAQSKKNQNSMPTSNEEEEGNAAMNGQSSSSYCSEDDSNASQELNGGGTSCSKGSAALNSNGKTRASRGSATDPQSLYARKRRERINERLRILQTLVPNGTKVDISTMLEEAVQYVKFLQLQIKLLSSDDLWMYAPLAYNGMDIGLDLKISASR